MVEDVSRRRLLSAAGTTYVAGVAGCLGGSDDGMPLHATLDEFSEFGAYDPESYESVTVNVIGCESTGELELFGAVNGIKVLLEHAVTEDVLSGARITSYESEADFAKLDGWEAYDQRANEYINGSHGDEDVYEHGGANVWVTEEYTTAHPVEYAPTAYTPPSVARDADRYPNAWGSTRYACAHELGHLLVSTTEASPNEPPLFEDPFDHHCDSDDLCHRDHTLADTVKTADSEVGVTVMSRPGNDRDHMLGECASDDEGDRQLYYGSSCFHKAMVETLEWAQNRDA